MKKIKTFLEIKKILKNLRKKGTKIVQCHGVFDLLHPGHIKHLKEAKQKGDKLIVSVTPDKFVNKGPGRPAFIESLRIETLASLNCVDYVILNDSEDAILAIKEIKPDIYVKGIEYKNHFLDVTGKISKEALEVEKYGGEVFYSDDIVFSSSALLNKYITPSSPVVLEFIKKVKQKYSSKDLIEKINNLCDLKVLVIGDAILDEYQYVDPLGQSGKGIHMVASLLEKEIFLGGVFILANHLAEFTKNVTLINQEYMLHLP